MQAELRPGVGAGTLAIAFAQTLRDVQVLTYGLVLLHCPKLSAYRFALLLTFSPNSQLEACLPSGSSQGGENSLGS